MALFCCIVIKPCPSGDPVYIRLGNPASAGAVAWNLYTGNQVTIDYGVYAGITWYVEGLCCDDACPGYGNCTGPDSKSVPFIDPVYVTQVATGDCIPSEIPSCCTTLTNCETNESITVIASNDLVFWGNLQETIVSINGLPGWWYVDGICCSNNELYPVCFDVNACSLNGVLIPTGDVSPSEWGNCPTSIYNLTNCQTGEIKRTSTSLYNYVGSTITLQELAGCWTVSFLYYTHHPNEDVIAVTVIDSFKDCECCLPPEPVKYTRVIPKPDKKYYQIKQSQCDITGNIRFAQAYYNLFKKMKYGISAECDTLEINKLWIKKQLSDLAMMTDPTICPTTPTPTVTVVCKEPTGK